MVRVWDLRSAACTHLLTSKTGGSVSAVALVADQVRLQCVCGQIAVLPGRPCMQSCQRQAMPVCPPGANKFEGERAATWA